MLNPIKKILFFRYHEHRVVDDIPNCQTVKEYKCEYVTKGYSKGQIFLEGHKNLKKTKPKGFSASKCDVGNWMFSTFWEFFENFLGFFGNFGGEFFGNS